MNSFQIADFFIYNDVYKKPISIFQQKTKTLIMYSKSTAN